MKMNMKLATLTWAFTLGICLLFSIGAHASEGTQCGPDPVDMFIGYGADILCAIDVPGEADLFRFDGTAGERIKIETLGTGYPCIELVGVTTGCTGHQNWIDVVLSTTQEYTIRVYDNAHGTGNYALFLERTVPPGPDATQITYGQNLPENIDLAGDLDEYFFTASVNDVVDITTIGGSNYPCFVLFAPDGTTTWTACTGHDNELRTNPLALAGTYTILVYDNATLVGNYRVVLECITGPCVVTPIPDVAGYARFQGAPLVNAGVSLTQPGAPSPQLTHTDANGYYQFLHILSGQTYNVLIHGQGTLGRSDSGDAKPEDRVDENPTR